MSNFENVFDCAIIGSGPAAYTAALKLKAHKIVLFEGSYKGSMMPGGQLMTTTDVDNFPGFPSGVKGPELMKILKKQAVTQTISKFVTKIEIANDEECQSKRIFRLYTEKESYLSRTIIVATGALARRIYVPGTHDHEFWQRGISSCAVCDGWAYRNKTVVVIGGGDTAMEEAKHLSGIAKKIFLVHRQKRFKARQDMLQNVRDRKNVEMVYPFTLKEVKGSTKVESAVFINTENGDRLDLQIDGIFFGIGHDPNSAFLGDLVLKDKEGYVIADDDGRTSCEGVFACGDVQDKKYRQAITAARSGYLTAQSVHKYLCQQ